MEFCLETETCKLAHAITSVLNSHNIRYFPSVAIQKGISPQQLLLKAKSSYLLLYDEQSSKDFTHNKNIPKIYDHGKGPFLSTYLQAFQDTTKPLETIYEQLNLFKRIFDERNAITGKEVSFSSGGVQIKVGDREICLDALSSGEKHDFIMFYNLILGEKTGGVVLIDEPEISLHIVWQRTYLDKLIEICKMNGLQAIIATHSPSIVSSHYAFVADKGESHG